MSNNKYFYPKVIIPKTIVNALLPPVEPKDNNPPLTEFVKNTTILFLVALGLIVLGVFVKNGIPIVLAIIILVSQYFAFDKFKLQKRVYDNAYSNYKLYLAGTLHPNSKVSYMRNGKREFFVRNIYIVNKVDESLKHVVEPRITFKQARRGRSELYFKQKLLKYLSLEFVDNQYEVRFVDVTYYPDIVIKSKVGVNTLYIDIEIDEPYSLSLDSRPIHHIETDDFRNRYFENGKWIIVRFSEEQVYKFTYECCELILSIIKHINSGGLEQIFDYDGIKVPHWSYNQGLQMKAGDYRSTYWPRAERI